jgi:Ca2+-binding RTX toxin-like protein
MAVRMMLEQLRWPVAALVAMIATLSFAASAPAATIRVGSHLDNLTDDTTCTLREAVIAADVDAAVRGCPAGSGSDVIVLGPGTYPLTIPASATPFDAGTGSLDVVDPDDDVLTITSFPALSVIDASAIADRVITAQSPLDLSNVTITGGDSSGSAENLGGAGIGGAVATFDSSAPLLIRRSVLAGNSASYAGGAVHANGQLAISNSTFNDNSVAAPTGLGGGGGGAIDAAGPTTITGSTIAGNTVTSADVTSKGGGLRYSGTMTVRGSIIADNSADGGDPDCTSAGGTGTSAGFNVIEDPTGCGFALAGSDVQADPALEPLADNGGGTPTMAIGAASPATDIGPAGGPSCNGTDQRGALRGLVEAGPCDAGAYEISYCAFFPINVVGGNGNDTVQSGRPNIYAAGLGGSDAIFGGPGDDALCGGPGVDLLQGAGGGDLLIGGADIDIASYRDAASPVAVTIDNLANDGRAGEGDVVQTESVVGGSAADLLRGNGVPNGLQGGPGNDRIDGVGGNDSVLGGPGNDIINGNVGNDQVRGDAGADALFGLDGNDQLEGGDDNDELDGGPGNDQLFSGEGTNTMIGGDGNDTLTGGLGKDVFKCGDGRDTAIVSTKDKVGRDCERVFEQRSAAGKGRQLSARALLRNPGAR